MQIDIEQLKSARFLLCLVTNSFTLDELRKKIILEVEIKDEDGKPKKYKDLSPHEKSSCDEAIEEMKEVSGIVNDIVKFKSRLNRMYFESLINDGFSPEQAMTILTRQPMDLGKLNLS